MQGTDRSSTSTGPVRVLIVDDSAVARRALSDIFGAQQGVEVVGRVASGALALQQLPQLRPDVITLDVEMPDMDGLETLKRIRQINRNVRVLMCSSLTRQGAQVAIDALLLGADDYIAKPAASDQLGMRDLAAQLRAKTLQFFPKADARAERPAVPVPVASPRLSAPAVTPVRTWTSPVAAPKAVVIGVSTGGPTALVPVLGSLPKAYRLPILIVQHMPPVFTGLLAERLNAQSAIEVREARDGDEVRAGLALLAPGGFHLRAVREGSTVVVRLDEEAPENSCRPAVDPLFRSAAEVWGAGCLGLILTGMGHDGLAGCRTLKSQGAPVIAQDEPTSVVWGMPGAVVKDGLADRVLPLDQIGPLLVEAGEGLLLAPATQNRRSA